MLEAMPIYPLWAVPATGKGMQCRQHPRETFVALKVAWIFFFFGVCLCLLCESQGGIEEGLFFNAVPRGVLSGEGFKLLTVVCSLRL